MGPDTIQSNAKISFTSNVTYLQDVSTESETGVFKFENNLVNITEYGA